MKNLFLIVQLTLMILPTMIHGNDLKTTKQATIQEIPCKSITLDQLKDMFSNISKNTKWDMNEPMLWGYFFTHSEPLLLEKARDSLVAKGYHYVDIYLSDKDDKNEPDIWWLHIEKIEIHTPESLDARNDEFCIFAHQLKLDSYDGMDVGPVKE